MKRVNNQQGDPAFSIKKLMKEPSPDKNCEKCKTKLPNKEKWKKICSNCYFADKNKFNDTCMFD